MQDQNRADAWIGDAVLTLYARLWILRRDGKIDGEKCERMTSNHFLSAVGEPTEVEARVGRLYTQQGMQAAFEWIDARLVPLFERQEENRKKRGH